MNLKERYYISEVDYKAAQQMVRNNHYLHRNAPFTKAYGLFDKTKTNLLGLHEMVGVVIYGSPASGPLCRGICGDSEENNIYELTRLWIQDGTPKNVESFLIGNTLRKLDKEIIISYSEPNRGHLGLVYQATNFIYTGLSEKRTDLKLEKQIMDHGKTKYKKNINNPNARWIDRPRKHRYVFFNCNTKRKKELLNKLNYPITPYPKLVCATIDRNCSTVEKESLS